MTYMNQFEIEECVRRTSSLPPTSSAARAARFLAAFSDEVNRVSDGWAYWSAPVRACERMMLAARTPNSRPDAFKHALTPIKAFMTRLGRKAGMTMPEID